MGGFRVIGQRKKKLIEGPLNAQLKRLHKVGINGMAYLSVKYNVTKVDGFLGIQTKKISGMISDLSELG